MCAYQRLTHASLAPSQTMRESWKVSQAIDTVRCLSNATKYQAPTIPKHTETNTPGASKQ